MQITYILIGALTSKEHVFSARPWELDRIESIDYFDSFGSKIYIEFCDFKILRIMPKIDSNLNSEWISNKVRFYYDSLKLQRLVTPILRKLDNTFILLNWFGVFLYFKHLKIFFFNSFSAFFTSFYFGKLYYFFNEDVDLLNLINLKNLSSNFSYFINTTFMFNSILKKLNIDFFHNYVLYPGTITFFKKFDVIYLFGYNIRCEHPLLFINLYLTKQLKLVVFGVPFLNKFKVMNLGLTVKDFFNFIYMKNIIILKKKINFFFKKQLFLIGSSLLNRIDGFIYEYFFNKLYFFLRYKYDIFCMIKYIYSNITSLNNIYLGLDLTFKNNYINFFKFKTLNFANFSKSSNFFLFLFNFFFFENELNFNINMYIKNYLSLYIYNGIQYNDAFCKFDLYLPITHFYERESVFYNLFAEKTIVKFVYSPMKNMKDSLDIYNYLYKYYNSNIKNSNKYLNIYKYLDFINTKYLNIYLLNNYVLSVNYKYYIYNNVNLIEFINFKTKFFEQYIYIENFCLSFIINNSMLLYNQHDIYLHLNVLKLSKVLTLASQEYKVNNINYKNIV